MIVPSWLITGLKSKVAPSTSVGSSRTLNLVDTWGHTRRTVSPCQAGVLTLLGFSPSRPAPCRATGGTRRAARAPAPAPVLPGSHFGGRLRPASSGPRLVVGAAGGVLPGLAAGLVSGGLLPRRSSRRPCFRSSTRVIPLVAPLCCSTLTSSAGRTSPTCVESSSLT